MADVESSPSLSRKLRTLCDTCQAQFLLDVSFLGRTVQCGQCRSYFVAVPSATNLARTGDDALANGRVCLRIRSDFNFLRRATLEDWQGKHWFVHYPLRWVAVLYFILGLALLCICLGGILLSVALFLAALGAGNVQALIPCLTFTMFLTLVLYPIYLSHRAIVKHSHTCVYHSVRRPGKRPWLLIGAPSFWGLISGRWQIETSQGEVLAQLRRPVWVMRWLTRRRWSVHLPGEDFRLVIEETFWLPPLVRSLLMLPLGLLRLVFFLTPWLLRPLRPSCRVRVAGSSYVALRSHPQLALLDTTIVEVASGVEELLDWRLLRALAVLLHGEG